MGTPSAPDSFLIYYIGAPILSTASNIHSLTSLILYLTSEESKSAIILAMTDSHFV